MKKKRFDWFMFLLVLPLALFGPVLLYFGARDNEDEKLRALERDSLNNEISVDSMRRVHRCIIEKRRMDSLVTKDDSIHYFEDGF